MLAGLPSATPHLGGVKTLSAQVHRWKLRSRQSEVRGCAMDKQEAVERPRSMWLHSAAVTTGAYVEAKDRSRGLDLPESGWLQSSIELRDGLEIAEFGDNLPQDAFDQLFRA
jgi:hypothetical protein